MTEDAVNRIVLENKLREAIKKEEFEIYYQPQMNGKIDQLIGMEALIRWRQDDSNIIAAGDFIPLEEETELIIELDQWTMLSATQQLTIWRKKNLNLGKLSLNLPVKQLRQENFIETLSSILDETSCNPNWIELEITESQIMTNPEKAILILEQISAMGIELAIDDFETGYSSLSYLKNLPIDKLKIDRSFIQNLPDNKDDIAITKSIISLENNLDLKVISEGVETRQQKDFLVKNGCNNIQEYFYNMPMPAQKMEVFLKAELQ